SSGGLATGSTASSGTSGGGGAASMPCTPVAASAPVTIAVQGKVLSQPELTVSSGDGRRVTVAFDQTDASGGASEIRHVSFEPWGAWPAGQVLGPASYAATAQ